MPAPAASELSSFFSASQASASTLIASIFFFFNPELIPADLSA